MFLYAWLAFKTTCKTSYLFLFYSLKTVLDSFGWGKPVHEMFTFWSSNVQDACTSPLNYMTSWVIPLHKVPVGGNQCPSEPHKTVVLPAGSYPALHLKWQDSPE